jgi:hypothetical protein
MQSGVQGTPTFFVNGVRHLGGYSYPDLVHLLEHPPATDYSRSDRFFESLSRMR